jgi:hypothetical protein
MKPEKSCRNCIKGTRIHVNDDILCPSKGVVSPNYVCGRHKYISDSEPAHYKKYKCINCEYFSTKSDGKKIHSSIGLCRLFSVRYFDGRGKNACSKFEHRQERGVS